jgi:hypothetical protein
LHPALVSEELFDRVQIVLKGRGHSWNRRNGWPALLHGFARCQACGNFVSTDRHGRFLYYRCRAAFLSRNRCRASGSNVGLVHRDLEQIYEHLKVTPAIRVAVRRAKVRSSHPDDNDHHATCSPGNECGACSNPCTSATESDTATTRDREAGPRKGLVGVDDGFVFDERLASAAR